MFVPTLLRPRLLGAKNRIRSNMRLGTQLGRDLLLIFFFFGVVYSIYNGISVTLQKVQESAHIAYLHPSIMLGLILLTLLAMLIFSNLVAALGFLFLSHDLDLIVATPLSPTKFFFGKLWEIVGSSSWMVFVFGVPVIIAFGDTYHVSYIYYLTALTILIPYFLIPAALAIILVTLFTTIIPANRSKEILMIIGGLSILIGYLVYKLLVPTRSGMNSVDDILQIVSMLSLPKQIWSPSYWAATCIGELLEPSGKETLPFLGMLYSSSIALTSAAYLAVRTLHFRAFSNAKSSAHGLKIKSRSGQDRLLRLTPFLSKPTRAILGKEIRIFLRDMSQAMQLMLLLGLCMIYLYNFRVLNVVEELPQVTRYWWQAFLTIANMAMGAFVMTAICTRFVFTSISLEGRSYWILQVSPIPSSAVLRAKFWCWLFPVGTISSIVLTSGALAINSEPHIVAVTFLISWIICYGIVGLAVGLGAFFANFDWEHSSQLAASFGSFVYMICSTVFIFINMFPTTVIIFLRTLKNMEYQISEVEWFISIASCAGLLAYINYYVMRWALKLGENALEGRKV